MRKVLKLDLDVLGASASLLCAIHCALVPLILSLGAISGMSFLADHRWDFAFIGVSLVLAFTSLINGYRKHHQRWRPIITASIGFTVLFIGHFVIGDSIGNFMAASGGLLIAAAHLLNYKACNSCKVCRH